jgi:hypothetical protein
LVEQREAFLAVGVGVLEDRDPVLFATVFGGRDEQGDEVVGTHRKIVLAMRFGMGTPNIVANIANTRQALYVDMRTHRSSPS